MLCQIGTWFREAFDELSKAPRYLIPCYFDALITGVYNIAEEVFWNKMSPYVLAVFLTIGMASPPCDVFYLRQGGYVFVVVCLLATLRKNFQTLHCFVHDDRYALSSFGSWSSDHYFHSVCWFVCLFVQSFSQPSLI